MLLVETFYLLATISMITENVSFHVSMAIFVWNTNSFMTIYSSVIYGPGELYLKRPYLDGYLSYSVP